MECCVEFIVPELSKGWNPLMGLSPLNILYHLKIKKKIKIFDEFGYNFLCIETVIINIFLF